MFTIIWGFRTICQSKPCFFCILCCFFFLNENFEPLLPCLPWRIEVRQINNLGIIMLSCEWLNSVKYCCRYLFLPYSGLVKEQLAVLWEFLVLLKTVMLQFWLRYDVLWIALEAFHQFVSFFKWKQLSSVIKPISWEEQTPLLIVGQLFNLANICCQFLKLTLPFKRTSAHLYHWTILS